MSRAKTIFKESVRNRHSQMIVHFTFDDTNGKAILNIKQKPASSYRTSWVPIRRRTVGTKVYNFTCDFGGGFGDWDYVLGVGTPIALGFTNCLRQKLQPIASDAIVECIEQKDVSTMKCLLTKRPQFKTEILKAILECSFTKNGAG